jgi:retron-type reverse transcriptase
MPPFNEAPMANTANNLWDRFIDFENIYKAYRAAARGKRYRNEALDFKENLEDNLFSIISDLQGDSYLPLPLRQFYVKDPKRRLISAPAFRDRVVHHALVQIIEPIFEKRFVNDNFACRVGRGTHAAMRHLFHCAQLAKRTWGSYYVLKCDVTKFFPSVNHDVLKRIVRRSIRDKRILRLIDVIIQSYESSGQDGTGIPIGALTSQLFANAYLDPMDHYLKETCQVRFYARYMDDFVILHADKAYLHDLLGKIEALLNNELSIHLNPKTGIFPGKHGIDFCGYRIWPTHIKPRKRTVKRAKKRLRKMAALYKTNPKILEHAKASMMSFFGYIKHCSGLKTTKSILKGAVFKPNPAKAQKPALPDN